MSNIIKEMFSPYESWKNIERVEERKRMEIVLSKKYILILNLVSDLERAIATGHYGFFKKVGMHLDQNEYEILSYIMEDGKPIIELNGNCVRIKNYV